MPKKRQSSKAHAEFIKADLVQRVRMATPLARELVTLGVNDVATMGRTDQMALAYHLDELVGHNGPLVDDDKIDRLTDSQQAAYALGIAVGLLMRPDAFMGGAR